jgi:hypothetical protein
LSTRLLRISRACDDRCMAERDRDESGRPRSTRPRDALGRPLPRGSQGIPPIPDDLELTPAETLRYAQDLLDQGLAFNAHEVLEAAWKNGPEDERMLWQGLAQLDALIDDLAARVEIAPERLRPRLVVVEPGSG